MHLRPDWHPFTAEGIPPLGRLVDVREGMQELFVEDGYRIPLSELSGRLSELPSSRSVVAVANTGDEAHTAVEFLKRGGRTAELAEFRLVRGAQRVRLWEPNEFLMQVAAGLRPGVVLDHGCGAGREAAGLACLGWDVIALDRLPDAIERARRLAGGAGVADRIRWIAGEAEAVGQADWSRVTAFVSLFSFEREPTFSAMRRLPGGADVVIEGFSPTHREAFGKPEARRTVTRDSFLTPDGPVEVESWDEGWRESGRHTVRVRGTIRQVIRAF